MLAEVKKLPVENIADIPASLRTLADQIEAGNFDDAHNLGWVIDCGNARIEIGMAGAASAPGAEAHLLFSIAARMVEDGCYTKPSP